MSTPISHIEVKLVNTLRLFKLLSVSQLPVFNNGQCFIDAENVQLNSNFGHMRLSSPKLDQKVSTRFTRQLCRIDVSIIVVLT